MDMSSPDPFVLVICAKPEFEFNEARGWFKPCSNCGGIAWSHLGADPLADLQNTYKEMAGEFYQGSLRRIHPPVVSPTFPPIPVPDISSGDIITLSGKTYTVLSTGGGPTSFYMRLKEVE